LIRHLPFLKAVFIHAISAFGGPQGHLGMMIKTFVEKRKDITHEQLIDLNSFCQILPGATSTQTLTLIGYKRGGVPLALLTFLIWIIPGVLIMSVFSFLIVSTRFSHDHHYLNFIQPMAIGFLMFAATRTFSFIRSKTSKVILVISFSLTYIFFNSPWIFPAVFILASLISGFFELKPTDDITWKPRKINFTFFILFAFFFILSGVLSETARKEQWKERTPYNLFENMYRFGSIVFGGADVLVPMMYEQYVVRPESDRIKQQNQQVIKISRDDFLTGAGIVRAIPGPVFSIASFIGGLSMSSKGFFYQTLGCFIAAIGIFLPSCLLVLFFYPIWENLHRFLVLQQIMKGINAAVVGIMIAGVIYLTKDTVLPFIGAPVISSILFFSVLISTFLLLMYTRIPAPLIALSAIILGIILQ
jgi:chromate transporter